MPYQFESRVRYSEVGEDQRLTLPGVIDYFQDCSTFHSEDLGVGLEKLTARGKAWILASWQIQIERLPVLGEKIVIQTWPYNFKGFYGERNFRILDDKGQTLASAASMWIYLDVASKRPSRVDEDIQNAYVLEEPLALGPISRKIPMPAGSVKKDSFSVMRSHLDTNHHVNNGQYIVMAEEYLPEGFQVKQIRVEYRKSAVLHDVIVPFVHEEADQCTISLCDIDEKPYAVIEFS